MDACILPDPPGHLLKKSGVFAGFRTGLMPGAFLRRGNNVEIPPEGAGACTGLLPEASFCIHLKKGASAVRPCDSLYNLPDIGISVAGKGGGILLCGKAVYDLPGPADSPDCGVYCASDHEEHQDCGRSGVSNHGPT